MVVPRREADEAVPSDDESRNRIHSQRRVSQTAEVVLPPAVSGAAGYHTACVLGADGDGNELERVRDLNRNGAVRTTPERIACGGKGKDAHLADGIQSPAVGCAVGRDAAGGAQARGDGPEGQATSDREGHGISHGRATAPMTYLSVFVRAPAIRGPGGRDTTGNGLAWNDGGEGQPACYSRRKVGLEVPMPDPELVETIRAPAVGGACRRQPAAVFTAGGHRNEW